MEDGTDPPFLRAPDRRAGRRLEIERRFLVIHASLVDDVPGEAIRQGYLTASGAATLRIRRIGDRGYVTIKGHRSGGMRSEFEYEIPADEADTMLETLCRHPLIEKTRHVVEHAGILWHVDVFAGAHVGLVIAECELSSPDQIIELPPWVGAEVTGDPRYRNSRLGRLPAEGAAAIRPTTTLRHSTSDDHPEELKPAV